MILAINTPTGDQKTTGGTLVHLIGIFTGFVGVGLIYLISSDDFTKRNARNALNWQLFATIIYILLIFMIYLNNFYSIFLGTIGLIALFFVLNPAFCILASIKAMRGKIRRYPIAPQII